ncbi:MAG: LysM peptidoglycan-binding domain-containing protein [Gammaproteobacteria bacterium]|nr:LysM peptidoglycan-binding domain-containing protein [Gammaproteobacteria bacterium]
MIFQKILTSITAAFSLAARITKPSKCIDSLSSALSLVPVIAIIITLSACAGGNPFSNTKPQSPIPSAIDTIPSAIEHSGQVAEHHTAAPPKAPTRPRHLPALPDIATPWWAVVARLEVAQQEFAHEEIPLDALAPAEVIIEGLNEHTGQNSVAVAVDDASPAAVPSADLWERTRQGFQLDEDHKHPRVRPYINWYLEHQAYLDRVVKRARPFLYDIVQEIERRDMPLEIALLPIVESAFQPFAYSPGRAAGIWQFIPATGKRYGLKQNWWYDGRRDVPRATVAALKYLSHLHKRFDGDWLLALAAYNSGEGRVARAIKKNRKKGRATDFWSLDLPDETRGYVPKLLAISAVVASAGTHTGGTGIQLATIPDEPYLQSVNTGSQIDLALAAELAELPIETVYQLNPAFNRWATDPDGPHELLLPIEKAETFHTALTSLEKNQRVRWERHRIRQGETLGHIARKFQTSVALLQEVNNIRDKWIRAGQSIIIPVATKNLAHYLSEDRRRIALQSTKRSGYKRQHTVKRGDTFWDLSRKYKVKVSQLATWNGMSPRDSLKPGQQLVIWTQKRNLASRQFVSLPHNVTHQQVHYRVRKGDSLARIAQKFSVTVAKLRRWNSLKKGKYLQPGQRLTLYVDVTQQS